MANSYLAQQRAPMFAELEQKPWLQNWLASIGESENSGKPLGILESLFNRAAMSRETGSDKSLEQLVKSGFYGPRTVQRLQSDTSGAGTLSPKAVANAKAALDQIKAGSNVTQGATDQGMENEIKSPWKLNVDGEYYGDMDNGAFRAKQQALAAKAGDSGTTPTAASTPSPSSTAAPAITPAPPVTDNSGQRIPSPIVAQAEKLATSGNIPAVQQFVRSQGYNVDPNWCGEFTSAVIKSTGGAPPAHGEVASSWLNWGGHVDPQDVQPGDVAVYRNARYGAHMGQPLTPGDLGGHVGIVGSGGYNPQDGTFSMVDNHGQPHQVSAAGLEFRRAPAGATTMANGNTPYGPPVPRGNIVQNGQMYVPAGQQQGQAPAMGGKGHGIYIPILSELFGGRMGQKGGYMQPAQAGTPAAPQPTSAIPTGPALQVGPTASKGPFKEQSTTASTPATGDTGPRTITPLSVTDYLNPSASTTPPTPGAIAAGVRAPGTAPTPGIGGPSRGVTGADTSIASTLAGITAPAPLPGGVIPGIGGPSRGITGGQPSTTVAGIPLSTPPATAPPSSPATSGLNAVGRGGAPAPMGPTVPPTATAPPRMALTDRPPGPMANLFGAPQPTPMTSTPVKTTTTPPPSGLAGLLGALNPVSSANAAEGPSAARAVAETQVPMPRANPIAGTQTNLTIPPRGPWPPPPPANVPLPRSRPPMPGAPATPPPPLPQNLGGTQMPPGAGPGVRMLDAIPPGYVPPNSADASPEAQNFNNSLRAMGITPPVLGDNTLKFNPDYARATGMSEDEIRRRMQQPPGPQAQPGSFAERFAGAPGAPGTGQYANPALAAALARYQGTGYPQSTAQGGPVPVGPGASQTPTPEQVRLDQLHRSPASGPVPTSSGDAGAPAAASTQDAVNAAIQEYLRRQQQNPGNPYAGAY